MMLQKQSLIISCDEKKENSSIFYAFHLNKIKALSY